MTDRLQLFDRVFCINLASRADRWDSFRRSLPASWPLAPVERVDAVDGKRVTPPAWWKASAGAWGCYRSHLQILERALNEGIDSILILEDDGHFEPNFIERLEAFLNEVPDDWGMLYLGGQHLKSRRFAPVAINAQVCIPHNVNRTHAYALRGATLEAIYHHLVSDDWKPGNHIDHHLGVFLERHDRRYPVYCPREWLIGQAAGTSDITPRQFPERFWQKSDLPQLQDRAFFALVGLHSSGSSALAGVAWGLGAFLGAELGGFYGNRPGGRCGYEDRALAEICEAIYPFPTIPAAPTAIHEQRFHQWITEQRLQAAALDVVPAAKYPQLCRLGPSLHSLCGSNLRLIVSDRDIERSISSLQARCSNLDGAQIAAHQRWLWEGLQELREAVPRDHQLVIRYEDLLAEPANEARRLAEFLGVSLPDLETHIARAIMSVRLYRNRVSA